MKKIILSLLITALSASAFAQEYATSLGNVSCYVNDSNEEKLFVRAFDLDWHDKAVSQYATVSPHGHVESTIIVLNLKTGHIEPDEYGYWVFSSKCAEWARTLPKRVRERFHGAFGVE